MTLRNLRPFALLVLALAVVACDQGRQPPRKTIVRVVNVAPTFESLDFRREQTTPLSLQFKSAVDPALYDEDTYDFFVTGRVGSAQQDLKTFEKRVVGDTTYVFVLHTLGTGIGTAILEYPTLPVGATDSQIVAMHAGESLPAMDIHIAPTGTNVNGAVPWGTLSFLQTLAPRRLTSGSYEITLTAAGDPSSVLFTSAPIALGAGKSSTFVITPEGGQTNQPLSVFFLQDTSTVLFDRSATASLRVLNGATDRAPRDIAVGGQFSPPLFSSVPFAQMTSFAPVAGGTTTLNATPPGNPGALELNLEIVAVPAVEATAFITGNTGVLVGIVSPEDNRRIPTVGKLRLYNAAQTFPAGVEFFVVAPGTDVTPLFPTATVLPGVVSASLPFTAGSYEIVMWQAGTATAIGGPIPVTLESGGIYSALAIDGATAGTAELVLFDDFP